MDDVVGITPPPAGPRRRARRVVAAAVVGASLVLVALLVVAGAAAAWRSLHTEAGTRWWLQQLVATVPGMAIDAPQGALLGDAQGLRLGRLTLDVGRSRVRIDELRIVGLRLEGWHWTAPHTRVQLDELSARRVDLTLQPATGPSPPLQPPASLQLPIDAQIDALRIATLRLPGLPAPIEALQGRLVAGATHRIDALSLRWQGLQLEGAARIGATAPLALQASVEIAPDPAADGAALPGWARALQLTLRADGPLAGFDADATLKMQAQQLDAQARITPFEPLPLSRLDARFARLDLAPLLAAWHLTGPTTALEGEATLALEAGRPLLVSTRLRNAAPGRWDLQRLPLRELSVRARGNGQAWTIETARAILATDERRSAGTLNASGRLDGLRGNAQLQLEGVEPAGLDRRGPPLRLGGTLALGHEPGPGRTAFGRLDIDAQLAGQQLGTARPGSPAPLRGPVQLALKGRASVDRIEVDTLTARAGTARLEGHGRAQRDAGRWRTEADLRLRDFDPAAWLPGEPSAGWRRAGNALNGSIGWRADVPAAAAELSGWLAGLQGQLRADIDRGSRLAGQPLTLQLQAEADGHGFIDTRASADAAGNQARVAVQLQAPTTTARRRDEGLQLQLDAPALASLGPLAEAFGVGPLAGRAQVKATAQGALGAWLFGGHADATLSTRGQLQLDALQLGSAAVERARGDWQGTLPGPGAGRAAEQTRIEATLDATLLRLPGLTVPSLTLRADGTLAEHRARLSAQLRQPRTPPTGEGGPAPVPLTLEAALSGGWQAGDEHAPSRWRARLSELALRPAGGATPVALPLIVARDLALGVERGPAGLLAQVEPGRAEVLGATLRWSALRWQRPRSGPPQLDLQAEVEPFVVAQLLQRLQPDFGWTGDLRVGARAVVRSAPAVSVHIEVARTGGDLQVSELGFVQSLGLTDLRVALDAEGGLWQMNQLVAGSNLGRVVGAQTVHAEPNALWPAAGAPIEGALRAQVENLGTWGAWVPAGWRLGGQVDATLLIAGRFGAPALTGEARGTALSLRNALEGVALSDGRIVARFDGDTAQLQELRFQAGDGELRARGDVRLGEQPVARLELEADRATVLGRVDRRVVASGRTELRLDAKRIAVDGELRVDEGLIDISRSDAPTLGSDVTVKRAGDTPKPADETAAAAVRRAPRAVDLKLAVDLGQRLRLRGRGLDTRLQGLLRLTTPGGKLAASGEVRTDDGTYEAYGQKLAIERGVITFVGDLANPRLDIEAVRANTDTRVGVLVSGNVQSPRVRLFSDPELPATEKLALLVTGKRYDSLSGADTLLLQRAAFALLAGDGSGTSSFDVARALQLDELSLRQSDGIVRDTVVTLGKQISERVYVGYERGLSATAGNWQLIYRIAQRFTLRAQSGLDPAVDLIWLFRWN